MLTRRKFLALPALLLAPLVQYPQGQELPAPTNEQLHERLAVVETVNEVQDWILAAHSYELRRIGSRLITPGWWKPRGARPT